MKAIAITIKRDQSNILGIGMLITTIILGLAIFNSLSAQTKIGLRGGLHISEPGLDTDFGNTTALTKAYTGIDIALVSEFELANRLSLQGELGYTEKGIRLGTDANINVFGASVPVGVTSTTKIRMIELPVLAKYQISEGAVRSYATAGPALGYAMSGNFKTSGTLLSEVDLVNQNLDLGTQNRWSIGAVGGLGVELDRGPGTLFLDARYHYQALKINNLPIDNVRFNNKGVGFNLGYKITI